MIGADAPAQTASGTFTLIGGGDEGAQEDLTTIPFRAAVDAKRTAVLTASDPLRSDAFCVL